MTKYIYLLTLGATALLLSNCRKPEPTVLEFNDSFTTTPPTPGERDTPPAVDVLTPYVYFADNQQKITIMRTIQEDESLAIDDPIKEFDVMIKNNAKKDRDETYNIEVMSKENTPKLYDTVIKGNTLLLPSSTYTLSSNSLTIKKGKKVSENPIKISFNKDELIKLDKTKEYILPLVIKNPEGEDAVPANYYTLSVTVFDMEKLVSGDNVSGSMNIPPNIEILEDLQLSAGNNETLLPRLTDGDPNGSYWWTTSGVDNWLMIKFEQKLITAIIIDQKTSHKLSEVSVDVANAEDGPFYPQGTCSFRGTEERVVITFNKPIKINRLKLHGIHGQTGYIALTEVRVAAVN